MDMEQEMFDNFDQLRTPQTQEDTRSIVASVPSELLRILECPVCAEFPSPPIYSCAKGHFTCTSCIQVLSTCTICESSFTKVRNFALEDIVLQTTFRCKYREQGCNESVKGSEFWKHILTRCKYGPIKCQEDETALCFNVSYGPEEFYEHLQVSHRALFIPSSTFGDFSQSLLHDGPNNTTIVARGYNEKRTFILHTKKYKSFVCWWMSSLLPEDENSQTTLRWFSKNLKSDPVITWQIPVHPINKSSFDSIRESGGFAILPIQQLNLFCLGEGNSWRLTFTINNLKKDVSENNTIWNTLFNFAPLLILILVGFLLCFYYELNEDLDLGSNTKKRDEYFGYRGFYYRNPSEL